MAGALFTAQIDYIYFVYGLAFIFLAAIGATRSWERPVGLPWPWLALFALVHGVHEWMELVALALGDTPTFAVVRLTLLTVSFTCLLEFGRRGRRAVQGKGVGYWVYVPFVVSAIAGSAMGLQGLNVSIRYGLGLPGAAWAGCTLFRHFWKSDAAGYWGMLGAAAMCGYAVAVGIVVPRAPFFPASWLNMESFLAVTGIPIQAIRAILAVVISVALWVQHEQWRRTTPGNRRPSIGHAVLAGLGMFLLLLAGWMATEWVGMHVVVIHTMDAAGPGGPMSLAVYRLAPIAVTLLTSVLLVGFFAMHRRLWESREVLAQHLAERMRLLDELQHAAAEVKTLRGLLPICANCKKIRDADGAWNQIEGYIQQRSEARFSHGLCPDCMKALYPDL